MSEIEQDQSEKNLTNEEKKRALTECINDNYEVFLKIACKLTFNVQDAEDLLHETIERVFKNVDYLTLRRQNFPTTT